MRAGHNGSVTGRSRCSRAGVTHNAACHSFLPGAEACQWRCSQQWPLVPRSSIGLTPHTRRRDQALSCSNQALATFPTDSTQDDADWDEDEDEVFEPASVVQIKVVKDLPRFDMPLLLGSVHSTTRTATAVRYKGQNYLLTTASNVLYGTQVRVMVHGQEQPYKAKVLHLAVEPDLAILQIQSPAKSGAGRAGAGRRRARGSRPAEEEAGGENEFWSSVAPLELAGLPALQDAVQLVGASDDVPGGSSSSTARVACVEVLSYPLASYRLLGISLEGSAVAKEHLGGAAVDAQGRCIGIMFQSIKGVKSRRRRSGTASQVKAVPSTVIQHVLDDVQQHGTYMGFSQLGIRYKRMDAPALRRYAGMSPEQQGVMVLEVNPTSSVTDQLRVGDVIMEWQGRPVGNDGCMPFLTGDSIPITHWVTQTPVGSTAQVTVLRAGKPVELNVRLSVPHRLLPTHLSGAPPSFLVLGGLVFTTLSVPYLDQCFGGSGGWMRTAPPKLVAITNTQPVDEHEQVVVIAYCSGSAQGLDGYKPELVEHQRVVGFQLGAGVAVDTPDNNQHKQPSESSMSESNKHQRNQGRSRQGDKAGSVGNAGGQEGAQMTPGGLQRVHNLRQLAAAVLGYRDGDIKLELADGSVVVVGAAQAQADARALMAEFEVQAPVSQDLSDLLPKKASAAPRLGGSRSG